MKYMNGLKNRRILRKIYRIKELFSLLCEQTKIMSAV